MSGSEFTVILVSNRVSFRITHGQEYGHRHKITLIKKGTETVPLGALKGSILVPQ